jgi:hypothetical protein
MKDLCADCGFCGYSPKPLLCEFIYKENPTRFIQDSLNVLKRINRGLENCGLIATDLSDEDVKTVIHEAFCSSKACKCETNLTHHICDFMDNCVVDFKKQFYRGRKKKSGRKIKRRAYGFHRNRGRKSLIRQKNKPEKQEIVPEFFCSAGFKQQIEAE